jgi:vitamin B12 transporter
MKASKYGIPRMIIFLWMFQHTCCGYAQDTLRLHELEIAVSRETLSAPGKKIERIDSLAREPFITGDVGALLLNTTPVFIKSYAPGGISTTSFRGGNASQTAVLWEGFNIQNNMLGQVDLSLIPSVIFDKVEVEYGGSASVWGSGAAAGTIKLGNDQVFGKHKTQRFQLSAGSFNRTSSAAVLDHSTDRFYSSTRLYYTGASNDYPFHDRYNATGGLRNVTNAAYKMGGVMQDVKWKVGPSHIFSLSGWASANSRQIPSYTSNSEASQTDRVLRLLASWKNTKKRTESVLRAATFYDLIDYNDKISNYSAKSTALTFFGEGELHYRLSQRSKLITAFNVMHTSATTAEYTGIQGQTKVSFLTGHHATFFRERITTAVCARVEYFSAGTLPVTGNAGADFRLSKNITAGLNIARIYRQPTLNEMYWQPGGNPGLKPEEGYTAETTLKYLRKWSAWRAEFSAAAYTRVVDNWILWVPGASRNPTPVNIRKVWSRGAESTTRFNYSGGNWRAGMSVITSYVLSTVQDDYSGNQSTSGRQLIYTPRYTVTDNLYLTWKNISTIIIHQYVGYRFTTSDNSAWLDPYHVFSLRMSYKLKKQKFNADIFTCANNIFSAQYEVMSARPMPMQSFEAGIIIQTKNKK